VHQEQKHVASDIMKILLTLNKTYRGLPDSGHWYVYEPLKQLGHDVYWFDTVDPDEKDYNKVIEDFKPDLIFCCLTNDRFIAPYEPWPQIVEETNSGRTKTFNWFCDDTWRFDTFSSRICHFFNVCSTPDPKYIRKYKAVGYDNAILGLWHANSDFYPKVEFKNKDIDISFIGAPTPSRTEIFENIDVPVENIFGVSMEELFSAHSRSKIGINFSTNDNDQFQQTEIKQRIFEITAGGGLLLTQHHDGIENFFEIDKEIFTFRDTEELSEKSKVLLKNPQLVESTAAAGHKRFLAEHDSKVRLANLLSQIRRT